MIFSFRERFGYQEICEFSADWLKSSYTDWVKRQDKLILDGGMPSNMSVQEFVWYGMECAYKKDELNALNNLLLPIRDYYLYGESLVPTKRYSHKEKIHAPELLVAEKDVESWISGLVPDFEINKFGFVSEEDGGRFKFTRLQLKDKYNSYLRGISLDDLKILGTNSYKTFLVDILEAKEEELTTKYRAQIIDALYPVLKKNLKDKENQRLKPISKFKPKYKTGDLVKLNRTGLKNIEGIGSDVMMVMEYDVLFGNYRLASLMFEKEVDSVLEEHIRIAYWSHSKNYTR